MLMFMEASKMTVLKLVGGNVENQELDLSTLNPAKVDTLNFFLKLRKNIVIYHTFVENIIYKCGNLCNSFSTIQNHERFKLTSLIMSL